MMLLELISTASEFAIFIFGFWIGRCARKLPLVDDNLPWTIHREQAPRCSGTCKPNRSSPGNGDDHEHWWETGGQLDARKR